MALKLAINNYYAFQRSSRLYYEWPDTYNKPPSDWKEQSMKYINKICKLYNIGFIRMGGTFIFNKNNQKLEVDDLCTI